MKSDQPNDWGSKGHIESPGSCPSCQNSPRSTWITSSFRRCRKAAARRVTRWSSTPLLDKNGSRFYHDPKRNTQNRSNMFKRLTWKKNKQMISNMNKLKTVFKTANVTSMKGSQGCTSWVVCTCTNNLLHILYQKYVTKILIRRKCNDEQCPMNQINSYKLSYFHGNESISNK